MAWKTLDKILFGTLIAGTLTMVGGALAHQDKYVIIGGVSAGIAAFPLSMLGDEEKSKNYKQRLDYETLVKRSQLPN